MNQEKILSIFSECHRTPSWAQVQTERLNLRGPAIHRAIPEGTLIQNDERGLGIKIAVKGMLCFLEITSWATIIIISSCWFDSEWSPFAAFCNTTLSLSCKNDEHRLIFFGSYNQALSCHSIAKHYDYILFHVDFVSCMSSKYKLHLSWIRATSKPSTLQIILVHPPYKGF